MYNLDSNLISNTATSNEKLTLTFHNNCIRTTTTNATAATTATASDMNMVELAESLSSGTIPSPGEEEDGGSRGGGGGNDDGSTTTNNDDNNNNIKNGSTNNIGFAVIGLPLLGFLLIHVVGGCAYVVTSVLVGSDGDDGDDNRNGRER